MDELIRDTVRLNNFGEGVGQISVLIVMDRDSGLHDGSDPALGTKRFPPEKLGRKIFDFSHKIRP